MMLKNCIKIIVLALWLTLGLRAEYVEPEYRLAMKLSEKSILLGDSAILSLELHYRGLEDYTILEPVIEGMSVEEISDDEKQLPNGMWIDIIKYKLTPQKNTSFKIAPQIAKIEFLNADYKGFNDKYKYLQKRNVSSNSLDLEVVALPKGVKVIGVYSLQTRVNVKNIKSGEPVKYTVEMLGKGNLQNLDDLELKIDGVAIYEKGSRQTESMFVKNFELVSDKSFVIPALTLEYFNKQTKKITQLNAKAYEIIVDGKKLPLKVKKGLSMWEKSAYFVSGIFVVLFVLMVLKVYRSKKQRKKEPKLIKELQKTNDASLFLKKVVPFLDRDKSLDSLIYKLETMKPKEFKKLKNEIIKKLYTIIA